MQYNQQTDSDAFISLLIILRYQSILLKLFFKRTVRLKNHLEHSIVNIYKLMIF